VRIVLDTNVLIAAFVSRGVCHDLFEHCERTHDLVGSDFILKELQGKLLKKFRVPPASVAAAVELVRVRTEIVRPHALDPPACRDPDDDWVLATALEGRCECIVTGDKDLLALDPFGALRIVAPGAFWEFEAGRRR
jgi:putative PIN family toxin of toxin-antitoxin system